MNTRLQARFLARQKARLQAPRLRYRARQFQQALGDYPHPEDLELAASVLTAPQLALFRDMQLSEQAHGLRVLRALQAAGEQDADLFTAALLHDAGKSRSPLRPWQRALIVVVGALCPACLERWGQVSDGEDALKPGWRRPFVVAVNHPRWGAELAEQAGASPKAVALIRRHQDRLPPAESGASSVPETDEDHRLRALQAFDDNN